MPSGFPVIMNGTNLQTSINTLLHPFELYTDSRTHGYQGPSRYVRLSRVTSTGGGSAIAKSEDGRRCVVSGKESLRILKISTPSHESTVGEGGNRIDASHNLWDGSGLKIDSANTDVAWGYGKFNNKILTSARNGELIMWDINKSGHTKYERRSKDHTRSINKLSISHIVHHYCITGSVEGDLRVWDLRDMTKSLMRVRHPSSVRSLVFSPSAWQPLQAIVGLDNGSIYRWDLTMGQRGRLDRLHVAHRASVTTLDWCPVGGISSSTTNTPAVPAHEESSSGGLGWIVSGGMDRTVKVWDLTKPGSNTHIPHKPTYILHPSFPVRRVAWRPGYECELAIVSNVEYATPADLLQQSPHSPSNAPLSRVGSAVALDALMKRTSVVNLAKERLGLSSTTDASAPSVAGDAIEIWDVRRGWIAKWSVSGSGTECGVSDITFRDSHAIWTQHISGTFTQFDLREATRPLDAIPRVSLSWEPAGSVAFVVDRKLQWEVPYDDIKPKIPTNTEVTQPPLKALGDPPARIKTQVAATYSHDFLIRDIETFTALAKGYIFEGKNRQEICVYNSGVALAVGNDAVAQVWSLLGAAMSDYLPEDTQSSANSASNDPEKKIHNAENPASNLTEYAFPASLSSGYPRDASSHQKISPGRRSTGGSIAQMPSHSVSRHRTPASSASPSPRHPPVSLPPITPRRPSIFTRRNSADTGRAAMPRQPSVTLGSHSHSASPSDRSTPRDVGEGVLDSDSSSGGSDGDGEGDETAGVNSTDDESSVKPHTSPGPGGPGSTTSSVLKPLTTPSPLSRAPSNQMWNVTVDEFKRVHEGNDDEDDLDTSPSPQSTSDTEMDLMKSISSRKLIGLRSRSHSSSVKRTKRTSASRVTKSRSRSSTVASLAAQPQRPKPLMHQDSHSSIKTVTAGEISFHDQHNGDVRADLDSPGQNEESRQGHSRQKSTPISEVMLNSRKKGANSKDYDREDEVCLDKSRLTERRIELIRADDRRFKVTTLTALRETLEEFAEEGDIQMCSMLALVAGKELGISRFRATRFVDSYIEILTRFRLHHCAAYLRKFCDIRDVQKKTLLETTIYTSCGRCRKPLAVPAGSSRVGELNRGRYAYCSTCRAPCVVCSICRLPVRTMLFQCPICNHGGHQACYRDYYLQYPMFDLPTALPFPTRNGRGSKRPPPSSVVNEDDSASTISHGSAVEAPVMHEPSRTAKLRGHPCAAGCGHFCWAVSGFDF